jgi:hypothetical protein
MKQSWGLPCVAVHCKHRLIVRYLCPRHLGALKLQFSPEITKGSASPKKRGVGRIFCFILRLKCFVTIHDNFLQMMKMMMMRRSESHDAWRTLQPVTNRRCREKEPDRVQMLCARPGALTCHHPHVTILANTHSTRATPWTHTGAYLNNHKQ